MYNAVGIDVSKGKSTVAVLQPGGVVIHKPFDVPHTSKDLNQLSEYLGSLDGDTKIIMECTDRYHEPMANALHKDGLFVSVVNPHLIKNFGSNSLRKVKSDPADARKSARYTLDNWAELRQYVDMDNTRTQLKTLNSQFSFFMKQKVAAKANLIALIYFEDDCADELIHDPVLTAIPDKKSLASQPTLSRFFNRMDKTTLNQFYILMRRFRKVVYAIKRPPLLLLDLDSTLLDTYGHQEGNGFNFHYQSHG